MSKSSRIEKMYLNVCRIVVMVGSSFNLGAKWIVPFKGTYQVLALQEACRPAGGWLLCTEVTRNGQLDSVRKSTKVKCQRAFNNKDSNVQLKRWHSGRQLVTHQPSRTSDGDRVQPSPMKVDCPGLQWMTGVGGRETTVVGPKRGGLQGHRDFLRDERGCIQIVTRGKKCEDMVSASSLGRRQRGALSCQGSMIAGSSGRKGGTGDFHSDYRGDCVT